MRQSAATLRKLHVTQKTAPISSLLCPSTASKKHTIILWKCGQVVAKHVSPVILTRPLTFLYFHLHVWNDDEIYVELLRIMLQKKANKNNVLLLLLLLLLLSLLFLLEFSETITLFNFFILGHLRNNVNVSLNNELFFSL